MLRVLAVSWPLLLGMLFLMVGNGVQGTLLGIRGALEGFTTFEMSLVMSAYFMGFLFGSRLTPGLIRRVGHVRVFAALGSTISAMMILYPTVTEPWAWVLMRVAMGFSFCGVYITAESWLNNAATNETRGKALSAYMIVQMLGIVAAQGLVGFGDPAGFVVFVIPSVLVSLAFLPILLSVNPAPAYSSTRPMGFRALFRVSPLGCVGMFLMGGVYAAIFGMVAVWGTLAGLGAGQISAFVAAIYLGGMLWQYPIGWISDRMDRRRLILIVAAACALVSAAGPWAAAVPWALLVLGFVLGGLANPLYSLLIAYTNDYLGKDEMAAGSGGLLFINGLGAILGPLAIGALMDWAGPGGFFLFLAALLGLMALYAAWRMTRRPAPPVAETQSFTPVAPTASPVAVEAAGEAA
jgi:MFS family permease